MTRKRKPYKTYPKEFKLEAVRLLTESGRPAAEIARELGLRRNQLYKWKEQLAHKGEQAFTGRGKKTEENRDRLIFKISKTGTVYDWPCSESGRLEIKV